MRKSMAFEPTHHLKHAICPFIRETGGISVLAAPPFTFERPRLMYKTRAQHSPFPRPQSTTSPPRARRTCTSVRAQGRRLISNGGLPSGMAIYALNRCRPLTSLPTIQSLVCIYEYTLRMHACYGCIVLGSDKSQ